MSTGDAGSTRIGLDWASPSTRRILGACLDGAELSVDDALTLTRAEGRDAHAVGLVADELRRRQVGDVVTYVVNRNINFTNVCIKHCTFCAFSRDHREEEGYFLPIEEVVRRAEEAADMGATEVCLQAGLPPEARRPLLHRPHAGHQARPARDTHSRLLARGGAVRLRALGAPHPRVS